MADSYTTLNTMLMANHIPPETAEQIICDFSSSRVSVILSELIGINTSAGSA